MGFPWRDANEHLKVWWPVDPGRAPSRKVRRIMNRYRGDLAAQLRVRDALTERGLEARRQRYQVAYKASPMLGLVPR